jgi:hypothetical protein
VCRVQGLRALCMTQSWRVTHHATTGGCASSRGISSWPFATTRSSTSYCRTSSSLVRSTFSLQPMLMWPSRSLRGGWYGVVLGAGVIPFIHSVLVPRTPMNMLVEQEY